MTDEVRANTARAVDAERTATPGRHSPPRPSPDPSWVRLGVGPGCASPTTLTLPLTPPLALPLTLTQEVEGGGATSETSEDFEKVEMQDAPEPAALEAEAAALEAARKTPRSSPAKPPAAKPPAAKPPAAKPPAAKPAVPKSCLKPPARPSSPGAQLDKLMGLAAKPPQSSSLLSLLDLPSFGCFRKVRRESISPNLTPTLTLTLTLTLTPTLTLTLTLASPSLSPLHHPNQVLREPINDVRAVLGVTLVGLAALALY